MVVSFKVSTRGTRFLPKPKLEHQSTSSSSDAEEINNNNNNNNNLYDDDQVEVDAHSPTNRNGKRKIDATGDGVETLGAEVSFILNIFPDGYSIEDPTKSNVGNQNSIQDQSKFLRPYDRRSEILVNAIECGQVPGVEFLGDISCKYINGSAVCEVRDYRKELLPGSGGVVDSSTSANYPCVVSRVSLKMSMDNIYNEISNGTTVCWTYSDLLESESRILSNLYPKMDLDPTPNLERLCKKSGAIKLNLNIPAIRRKRLRQMSRAAETSTVFRVQNTQPVIGDGNSRPLNIMGRPDFIDLTSEEDVVESDTIAMRTKTHEDCVRASPSISLKPINQHYGTQSGQMSSSIHHSSSLNIIRSDGNQSQMETMNSPKTLWNNMLLQKQMPFTKQEPVETQTMEKSKSKHQVQQKVNTLSENRVVSDMIGPFSPIRKEADEIIIHDRFSKIKTLNERFNLNCKNNKSDEYNDNRKFVVEELTEALFRHVEDESVRDETCKKPLSKSLVDGNVNICKTRIVDFVADQHMVPGEDSSVAVPKFESRLILSERPSDGTVGMHYGELLDCDNDKDCMPQDELLYTLPNTHTADLLADQLCSQMVREGYRVQGDHVKRKSMSMVGSSVSQPNTTSSSSSGSSTIFDTEQIWEKFLSEPVHELAKPSNNGGTRHHHHHHNMPNGIMNPHSARLFPSSRSLQSEPDTFIYQQQQQQQLQNWNSLMQQQPHERSSENLLPIGHKSSMQKQSLNYTANDWVTDHLLQQQQQQSSPTESKLMMGTGNVGSSSSSIGRKVSDNNNNNNNNNNNSMLKVAGLLSNTAGTRMVSPIIGHNNGSSINQGSAINNSISHQLYSGPIYSESDSDVMIIEPKTAQSKPIGPRNVSRHNSMLKVEGGQGNLLEKVTQTGIVSHQNHHPTTSMNHTSTLNNSFTHQLPSGPIKSEPPAANVSMATKPKMTQSQPIGRLCNIGMLQGSNRQIHPTSNSSCASILNYGFNRRSIDTTNEMQRDVMGPPKSTGIGIGGVHAGIGPMGRFSNPGSSSGSSCASILNYRISRTIDINEMQRDVMGPPKSTGIGIHAGTGMVSPDTGSSSMNKNQGGSTVNESITQLLVSGPIKSEPADADVIMAAKPRMSQSRPRGSVGQLGGGLQGANRQTHPRGSSSNSSSSMLNYGINRTIDMNEMQREVMGPPRSTGIGIGGARAGTGIVSTNKGGSTVNESTSHLLVSGPIMSEPAAADAIMASKPRMSQSQPNVPIGSMGQLGGRLLGANRQTHPHSGSSGSSILSYGINRTSDMQRNVMPVLNQNHYMNQQHQQFQLQKQETGSQLQAVMFPSQQAGSASPWVGMQQQQQPMPVNPQTGPGNQEGATPQITFESIDKFNNFWM